MPAENLNLLQAGLSLKTRLGLNLAHTLTKEKISIFFQKIKPTTIPVQHVKGQPAASTYVREKGVLLLTLIVGYPVVRRLLPSYLIQLTPFPSV